MKNIPIYYNSKCMTDMGREEMIWEWIMTLILKNMVVIMWLLIQNQKLCRVYGFWFSIYARIKTIQSILRSHFFSVFPCYCFPKRSKAEDEIWREQILTNSSRYPPSPLSFHALCKHMHFPLSALNYFLKFFLHPVNPKQKVVYSFPFLKFVFSSLW